MHGPPPCKLRAHDILVYPQVTVQYIDKEPKNFITKTVSNFCVEFHIIFARVTSFLLCVINENVLNLFLHIR